MSRGVIVVFLAGLMTFTCGTLRPVSTRAQQRTPTAEAAGVEIAPGVMCSQVSMSIVSM